jgi:hypothetical protein
MMLLPHKLKVDLVSKPRLPRIVVNDTSDSEGVNVTKTSDPTPVQLRLLFVVLIRNFVDESRSSAKWRGVGSENITPTLTAA